jgi:hypothetical protein
MVKQSLEDRLAVLEIKFTEWESRRRRLIPAELEADENVQMVVKDCLGEYTRKMKNFAGQRRLDDATTEINRLRAEAAAVWGWRVHLIHSVLLLIEERLVQACEQG